MYEVALPLTDVPSAPSCIIHYTGLLINEYFDNTAVKKIKSFTFCCPPAQEQV